MKSPDKKIREKICYRRLIFSLTKKKEWMNKEKKEETETKN